LINNNTNKNPSSRLDDLREKLKSLESRSSSLSQRISTLMTERESKNKVDYADLMTKIKGTSGSSNSQGKFITKQPNSMKVARHQTEYDK
jgi:hypothetical protein